MAWATFGEVTRQKTPSTAIKGTPCHSRWHVTSSQSGALSSATAILVGGDLRVDLDVGCIDGGLVFIFWQGDLIRDDKDRQAVDVAPILDQSVIVLPSLDIPVSGCSDSISSHQKKTSDGS